MTYLQAHKQALYELRFSPMCKPAGEVANLTRLESHSTRGRVMMLWRIAAGMIDWGPREVELVYQATLDSISEAFDVFHYPVSQYMLAARADIWAAGLAPDHIKSVVKASASTAVAGQAPTSQTERLLIAGEIAQLGEEATLTSIRAALEINRIEAPVWRTSTGALAYTLGARDVAKDHATQVRAGIAASGAQTIIADGPETAWALTKIYPALGLDLPEQVTVKLLSEVLDEQKPASNGSGTATRPELGTVFVHDSRPACLLADRMANNLAILPGYVEDESAFGTGSVYETPRRLIDRWGGQRVFGTWTRSLAKSSGADDGLWLTYPRLAAGLAAQRLDYAEHLGATTLITDSPLAASFLAKHAGERQLKVKFLAELVAW
jgi:hypothetical protein